MATNLRLRPEAEAAVREAAARTGQSQQELIRAAVDSYLGLGERTVPRTAVEALLATHDVLPPRTRFRELDELVPLPRGASTEALLDRDERS